MEGNFECKVSGKRESANGIFLTLQIQPDDYHAELATLRVGSHLMLGWAEVLNSDVEPIELVQDSTSPVASVAKGTREGLDSGSTKKFHELPASQQCAIICADPEFQSYWELGGCKFTNADEVANSVKNLLRIKSRKELDTDPESAARWSEMLALFRLHQQRHGGLSK